MLLLRFLSQAILQQALVCTEISNGLSFAVSGRIRADRTSPAAERGDHDQCDDGNRQGWNLDCYWQCGGHKCQTGRLRAEHMLTWGTCACACFWAYFCVRVSACTRKGIRVRHGRQLCVCPSVVCMRHMQRLGALVLVSMSVHRVRMRLPVLLKKSALV